MMTLTVIIVTVRKVGSGGWWQWQLTVGSGWWWEVKDGGRVGKPVAMMTLTVVIIAIRKVGRGGQRWLMIEDGWQWLMVVGGQRWRMAVDVVVAVQGLLW